MVNFKSQHRKHSYQSTNEYKNSSVIKYLFLGGFDIFNVHDDYIEQFLFHTKTYSLKNILLYADYESLQRVTHNCLQDYFAYVKISDPTLI